MKRKYKIDLWSSRYKWITAYYRPWWWPFYMKCYSGTNGMCDNLEAAEKQAKDHATRTFPKHLGWM